MLHGAIGRALASHAREPGRRERGGAGASLRAGGGVAGRNPLRPSGRGAGGRAQPVRRRAGHARSGARVGQHACRTNESERPDGRPAARAGARCARRWASGRANRQIIDTLIAQLARDGSSARLAEVYLRQGDLSTLLKRFDAADRALSTALRIGQERGDTTLLRSGLRSLGLLRWHEGRHDEALDDHAARTRRRSRVSTTSSPSPWT